MSAFATQDLRCAERVVAPDGSIVLPLVAVAGGSMACFELQPGQVSHAVTHCTVDELWFVRCGRGELWRSGNGVEETTRLAAGIALTIPLGTHFQFRAAQHSALCIVGVTLPPWPGKHEAVMVEGPWIATEN